MTTYFLQTSDAVKLIKVADADRHGAYADVVDAGDVTAADFSLTNTLTAAAMKDARAAAKADGLRLKAVSRMAARV